MTQQDAPPAARDLVGLLARAGCTVATAESLTGGMLGAAITGAPGASRVYRGGVVAYATPVKESLLGVPADVVRMHGVVSEACVSAMARGVRGLLDATYGVATTGVAGPDAQEGHPPGTVWIAVAGPGDAGTEPVTRLLDLAGGRDEVRRATCAAAIGLVEEILRREVPGLG